MLGKLVLLGHGLSPGKIVTIERLTRSPRRPVTSRASYKFMFMFTKTLRRVNGSSGALPHRRPQRLITKGAATQKGTHFLSEMKRELEWMVNCLSLSQANEWLYQQELWRILRAKWTLYCFADDIELARNS